MLQSVLVKKTNLNYRYQNAQSLELKYFLISGEYGDPEIPVHKGYGVNIKLCSPGKILDEKTFEDIDTSMERMVSMIGFFCDKAVTPANLQYVLEDTLGQF